MGVHFKLLGLFFFLVPAGSVLAGKCRVDTDCQISKITGSHSLFCVDGQCVQLKPPGSACNAASECASYPFFGPLACSSQCDKGLCCQFIPTGSACSVNRPIALSGCTSGFTCSNKEIGPVCVPTISRLWVFGPVLSITGNLFINVGLNLQKKSYTVERESIMGLSVNLFGMGVFLYVVGKISGFSSYVFGNQSLMTSLGAVGPYCKQHICPDDQQRGLHGIRLFVHCVCAYWLFVCSLKLWLWEERVQSVLPSKELLHSHHVSLVFIPSEHDFCPNYLLHSGGGKQ
ncbi:hypothetical protein NERG_00031 [Nematocida ausubeli]|uniref:Uncharacterized protein n=1 Tax=Nematocida ausubeli (strain ATCC PRA-371 / ERTm2) TaxID=1913371 RepID=H8Z8W0_NEMA1|nr:hypothetical protein NERG_00031 [Nematocida ausubeli]